MSETPSVTEGDARTELTRAELQKRAEELHDSLVARYAAGETVKALAAEHGLHHQTVRALLVKAGAFVRTRRRLTPDDVNEVARLYEAGLITTEIGDRFGVYASTVQRQLKRLGVALRPASRRTA